MSSNYKKIIIQLVSVLSINLVSSLALAQFGQPPLSPLQQKVQQAMQGDIRTEEERERDANRRPVQVLDFFRLEDDMTVIELLPAGGWYTKILGPVLRDNGKLYITQPDFFYSAPTNATLALPELSEVERLPWGNGDNGGSGLPASEDWGIENADMVLTFRNYHNFSVAGRMAMNESSFNALKPGGYYGVIDHTRRHMEADNNENGRRVDPVTAIKEIQQAGFILIDYSTQLARPDDELRYEVGRPSVTGNTDRFTFLFQKPE